MTSTEETYFDFYRIPDHVLLKIFSFLSFDALGTCSRVCKRWNEISKADSLRNTIDLSDRPLSAWQMRKLIELHCTPALRVAKFCQIQMRQYPSIKALLSIAKDLRRLDLVKSLIATSQSGDIPSEIVMERGFMPSRIVHLSLRGCLCGRHPFFKKDQIDALPHLRCLDLGETHHADAHEIEAISQFPNLRSLYLDEILFQVMYPEFWEVCMPNPAYIVWRIPDFSQLQVLDCEGLQMGDEAFTETLKKFASLKKLYVGHTSIENLPIERPEMKEAVLIELCIRNTKVSVEGIYAFLSARYQYERITLYCAFPEESVEILRSNRNWVVKNSQNIPKIEKCRHYRQHTCI